MNILGLVKLLLLELLHEISVLLERLANLHVSHVTDVEGAQHRGGRLIMERFENVLVTKTTSVRTSRTFDKCENLL